MRRAFWLAAVVLAVVWGAMVAPGTTARAADEPESAGKAVFTAEKCATCHSLSAAGIEAKTKSEKLKGPDLAGATDRHEADWLKSYLRKELEVDGETHKREFKGSDEELAALLKWLAQFPAEEG